MLKNVKNQITSRFQTIVSLIVFLFFCFYSLYKLKYCFLYKSIRSCTCSPKTHQQRHKNITHSILFLLPYLSDHVFQSLDFKIQKWRKVSTHSVNHLGRCHTYLFRFPNKFQCRCSISFQFYSPHLQNISEPRRLETFLQNYHNMSWIDRNREELLRFESENLEERKKWKYNFINSNYARIDILEIIRKHNLWNYETMNMNYI